MLTSSTSSSPTITGESPNLKARAFRSPRPFASPSGRPSVKQTLPSFPHPSINTTIVSAPTTADAGTQYSPPDWPPTDPRSSRYQHTFPTDTNSATAESQTSTLTNGGDATVDVQRLPFPPEQSNSDRDTTTSSSSSPKSNPAPPPEPQVRITPQSSLSAQNRRRSSDDLTQTKRPRQDAGSDRKVLPSDYTRCEPKVLAGLIANMLMRLIQHNDVIPLQDGQLTRFHSRAPPAIGVVAYMERLTFHATLSPPILLSMVFFIDRLSYHFPDFIINSLTVHRFLITAATVASKGLSDSFWTNSTYARVGGVSVKELALLELELLVKCGYRIVPSPERLVEYYNGLVEGSEEYVLEGQTESKQSRDARPVLESNGTGQDIASRDQDKMDTAEPN